MWPIATDVAWSVCVTVVTENPANVAEPTEVWSWVVSSNHALHWAHNASWEGALVRGHTETCQGVPAVGYLAGGSEVRCGITVVT